MRKILPYLAVAAAMAIATPAFAYNDDRYPTAPYAAPLVGAAVGTAVGVGTYNAWWGTGTLAATLPTSVAGAAVLGGVAGVGTIVLIDAAVQPCRGFQALLGMNKDRCVNGQYVEYAPRHGRVIRR